MSKVEENYLFDVHVFVMIIGVVASNVVTLTIEQLCMCLNGPL